MAEKLTFTDRTKDPRLEQIKQQYLESVLTTPEAARVATPQTVIEDIGTAAEKGGVLGGIGAGVRGLTDYLQTKQGQKVLGMTAGDRDLADAYLAQAEQAQSPEAAQAAYAQAAEARRKEMGELYGEEAKREIEREKMMSAEEIAETSAEASKYSAEQSAAASRYGADMSSKTAKMQLAADLKKFSKDKLLEIAKDAGLTPQQTQVLLTNKDAVLQDKNIAERLGGKIAGIMGNPQNLAKTKIITPPTDEDEDQYERVK